MTPDIHFTRPCSKHVGGKFCKVCEFRKRYHEPRFQMPVYLVGCSACGRQFKSQQNHGYSHCDQHPKGGW